MTNETGRPPRFPEYAPGLDFQMVIGDKRGGASDGATFRCHDPFENESWGHVPLATADDVDRAVTAARSAFPQWSSMPPAARGRILRNWADLIERHAHELARLQVRENGKTIVEMTGATLSLVGSAHYFATLGEMPDGHTVNSNIPGHELWTKRIPIGVVAAITPWNNPLGLLSWKLFPALAAGNCVVVKPSEVTPASTLRLVELGLEAGLPAGVVNVVTGFGATGAALVEHPGVDKIAFTGSTSTGKKIASAAIDRMARVTLELGGKSPNIVFADADLDRAIPGLLAGVISGTGQACNCGSRILVEASIYDEVKARLTGLAKAVKLGDPLDPATQIGPLASPSQFDKVMSYFDIARDEGHELLTGGRRAISSDEIERGLFVEPTFYSDVCNRSRIAREEIFGPVGAMMPFKDEAEAISLANDSNFGLVAGIWSENVSRVHRVMAKLRAGTVWGNTWRIIHHQAPFGGFGESGIGRELGVDALHAYTEAKTHWLGLSA